MKFLLLFASLTADLSYAGENHLNPVMVVPDGIVFQSDFSESKSLNKKKWSRRQGTQWSITDGVLRGKPSTAEYQAKKADHKGYEARISAPMTPPQFVAKFSIRFIDGAETKIVPFIEFGHHVCRIKFSEKGGLQLLADHETMLVAEAEDFRFEPGKWMHVLAEMKGDEFVIQIAGGPTLYAKHPSFAVPASGKGNGLGVAGPKGGKVEIDDLTLWTIKPGSEQDTWADQRGSFSKFEPVQVKKKPTK